MPNRRTDRPPAVAAFDVDGTLTTRDCVTPFLRERAGARLPLALVRRPHATVAALCRRDRDVLKELASHSLHGIDARALEVGAAAFAERVHRNWMRPDTVGRLAAHRERGDVVVLVSASFEPYLRRLASLLEADAVLGTRLEVGADGRLTGRLDGENCRGPEKVRRLRAWLADEGLEALELWAYGDSVGDDELLAYADHPLRVDGIVIEPSLS